MIQLLVFGCARISSLEEMYHIFHIHSHASIRHLNVGLEGTLCLLFIIRPGVSAHKLAKELVPCLHGSGIRCERHPED